MTELNTELGSNQEPVDAQAEIMVPQSKVNKIVGAKLQEGHQKGFNQGYNQALQELQQTAAPAQQQNAVAPSFQAAPAQNPQQMGGMSQLSHGDIDKMIQDKLVHHQNEARAQAHKEYADAESNRIRSELAIKVNDAKKEIPDYDSVVNNVDWSHYPKALAMSNSVDNAGHVLYHLAKNPRELELLNNTFSPHVGMMEIRNLSGSIKGNTTAVAKKKDMPQEPIDQVIGSGASADSGLSTVDDFRNQPGLRA